MRLAVLASALAALAAAVEASPLAKRYVVHETRSVASKHAWRRAAKMPRNAVLPLRIGLAQQNLENAETLLGSVSHPDSPSYGKHWTPEQVAATFAPTAEAVEAVLAWLTEEGGIARDRLQLSRGRNWVSVNATVEEAERLLQTEYHVYRHAHSGSHHVACERYHVPENVRQHVDLVLPTVQFDNSAGVRGGGAGTGGWDRGRGRMHQLPEDVNEELKKRARQVRRGSSQQQQKQQKPNEKRQRPVGGIMGSPLDASLPKQGAIITNALMDLNQCDTMITPACLRALYNTPVGSLAAANNSIGIVEYTPQAILQTDLNLYFSQFQTELQGKGPIVKLLDNAVVQTTNQSFSFNGESALDLEFAMALVYPQTATLFQVGDLVQGGSFNNLLDSLDASYCNFRGGGSNDSSVDGQYSVSVGCGTAAPTNVISTSYSYNEGDLTPAYERRQCNEYMKLGLQGITIVYSSGDFGVAGNGNTCIDSRTGAYNNGSSGLFNPSFPGSCPYVTSVGATQLRNGTTVRSAEAACEKVIFSGGGFSNVFPMPSYQQKAVASYFANSPPPYGANRFNNSRTVRGYPDVSANGANYVTAVNGNFSPAASAPVFAAIVNLINEQRIKAGKRPVGFINPVLYANPQVLNDITSGNNPGCGTTGFAAVKGWDPLTGLGTPNCY